MKKNITIIILALFAASLFGAEMTFPPLPDNMPSGVMTNSGRLELWSGEYSDPEFGKMLLDLGCYHVNTNSPPRVNLVAKSNNSKYVIWWMPFDYEYPDQFACNLSSNKNVLGVCFLAGGTLVFYQIYINKALEVAKRQGDLLPPAAWLLDGTALAATNYFRYRVPSVMKLLEVRDFIHIEAMELHSTKDKWLYSMVVSGPATSETKVSYQYPLAGTGLKLLKKEPVPPVAKDVVKCQAIMSQIVHAKAVWAAGHPGYPDDPVDTNELFTIRMKGIDIKCPDGGVYDVGAVGEMPKCSIHGVYNPKLISQLP